MNCYLAKELSRYSCLPAATRHDVSDTSGVYDPLYIPAGTSDLRGQHLIGETNSK